METGEQTTLTVEDLIKKFS